MYKMCFSLRLPIAQGVGLIPCALIELYVPRREDEVLVPFCGSGATLR